MPSEPKPDTAEVVSEEAEVPAAEQAGDVTIGGIEYAPKGDLNQRIKFQLDVLEMPLRQKREAICAIGFETILEVLERQQGTQSADGLNAIFLGLYSEYMRRWGIEHREEERFGEALGFSSEIELPDQLHVEVGMQIAENLQKRGFLKTPLYIDAFRSVPRSKFLLPGMGVAAYMDRPLPIGFEQTNSQPSTVALMLEMLQPQPGERMLDVGSGSGWTTALLGHIAGQDGEVVGLEVRPELVTFGTNNLEQCAPLGVVEIRQAKPDTFGLPDEEPFDRILVSAGKGRAIPAGLKQQLKIGGKIVCPIEGGIMEATRVAEDEFQVDTKEGFAFVTLVESPEQLRESPKAAIAGEVSQSIKTTLQELGYDITTSRTAGNEYQAAFDAYQADLVIVIDEGAGRTQQRVDLGAAIGSLYAGKEKEICLVGQRAAKTGFSRMPQVHTFKTTRALLHHLRRRTN